MEEIRDHQGNVVKLPSLRVNGSVKSTLSGKSTTPRASPTLRRLNSNRTPRREGRVEWGRFYWFRSNRLLLLLILITIWTYLGFYVQSKWAHGDSSKAELIGYRSKTSIGILDMNRNKKIDIIKNEKFVVVNNSLGLERAEENKNESNSKKLDVILIKIKSNSSRIAQRLTKARKRSKTRRKKVVNGSRSNELMEQEEEIPKRNTSYGLLVGPFGLTEDKVLGWNAEQRSGTCDKNGEFARIVSSRNFVLIFHELSMTGAPLSMMELATELLSCGATVSAVVLSRRGGLMAELTRRRINVVEDKAELSYKTAMKADLVIAGSAVCAQWIEQYLQHNKAGSNQIAWWIMENRRQYFDRAKLMLNRVKLLIFLSESQSEQWLAWTKEEGIKLNIPTALFSLSVNDELAFVAGIPCSLNTPLLTVEKMVEKRRLLRDEVRKEMGLTDKDMLVMSLSSINPGKGQLFLLESARLAIEEEDLSLKDYRKMGLLKDGNVSDIVLEQHRLALNKQKSRDLLQTLQIGESENESETLVFNDNMKTANTEIGFEDEEKQRQNLKVLIGSVGSKSNKVPYVKGLLRFLSQHPRLAKLVVWSPSTTRVASLYSAADAYIINSQGIGETFGRVTIEAMAFGLPVLGTDAGGTREIVEQNVTGLLHPVGRAGTKVLAQNLLYLLKNPLKREEMGLRGRSKVERMYLKTQMYEKFALVLLKYMKIK